MVKRNLHIAKLNAGYLFPEIHKRKMDLLKRNPSANIISLGIGDTTEPIPSSIGKGLVEAAKKLSTKIGYSGYGPEQGILALREKIAEVFYKGEVEPDEIFISDGTKCDIGRLQVLFGSQCITAVQDPSYPAYVDTAVAIGQTGRYGEGQYENICYMPCHPGNGFFPDLEKLSPVDLIYFCSPNNPTGTVASRKQLAELIAFAKKSKAVLIFDAAYASYIRNASLPRSIFELPGAKDVAIELNSFSKMAGFTGVRLGWSVVPKTLCYSEGTSIHADWLRLASTFFNGASNIAQAGGMAALDEKGLKEIEHQTDFYLKNAELIKKCFGEMGYEVYGGENAPYVWVRFPGVTSWGIFNTLLENAFIVSTPGIGFGPSGEGFLRFSAFGSRSKIEEALGRLKRITFVESALQN